MAQEIIILILGMAIATYLPRMLPLVALSRFPMPKIFLRWLSFIPVSVLAALLAPGIFLPEGALDFSLSNHYLLAAIPSLIIAWASKSLAFTLMGGMLAMVIVQAVF